MRSFEESGKSKKTVASMIERKGEEKNTTKQQKKKEVNFVEGKNQFAYSINNNNYINKY